MEYILGIDTGGTYTDAVVICENNNQIVSKAKVFTTHDDLSEGIRSCIEQMNFCDIKKIKEIHLSTTIVVNKILEGEFQSIGILQVGKCTDGKLPGKYSYNISIPGSCSKGLTDRSLCNMDEIKKVFAGNVEAIIVSAAQSKYSRDSEGFVSKIVEEEMGIKCISASDMCDLDDRYDRLITAAFTTFLRPVVKNFIQSIKSVAIEFGITDRIFIVNALGKLISCDEAVTDPLKTVFSGLAASVNGGIALTKEKDFLLLDMGGTSSDVTRIIDSSFREFKGVAKIGGYRIKEKTMNIKSYGVGGDSYIRLTQCKDIEVGPQRAIPLCVAADLFPHLYNELLTYQKPKGYELLTSQEINCYIGVKGASLIGLDPMESLTARYLVNNPHNIFFIAEHFNKDADALHMDRLIKQNAVRLISLTPTDILHAEGRFTKWNTGISVVAVKRMAAALNMEPEDFLTLAEEEIINALSKVCMQGIAAFEDIEFDFDECQGASFLLDSFFKDKNKLIKTDFSMSKPIVAVGAPAGAWMDKVATRLKTRAIIPKHGEVANAFGAAIAEHD